MWVCFYIECPVVECVNVHRSFQLAKVLPLKRIKKQNTNLRSCLILTKTNEISFIIHFNQIYNIKRI